MWSNQSRHQDDEKQEAMAFGNMPATPHFDAEAVRQAKRVTPFSRLLPYRHNYRALITIAIIAGILGGVVVGLLVGRYLDSRTKTNAGVSQASRQGKAQGNSRVDGKAAAAQPPAAPASSPASEQEPPVATESAEEPAEEAAEEPENVSPPEMEAVNSEAEKQELRQAFQSWKAAHRAGDVDGQMGFYHSTVQAFYRWRGASRENVRAEKLRVFEGASAIHIEIDEPQVSISPDGQQATTRFRKRYRIDSREGERNGEVLQELRWQRVGSNWRIVSERDLKVLR